MHRGDEIVGVVVIDTRPDGTGGIRSSHYPGNPPGELHESAGFGRTGEMRGEEEPAMALALKT